MHLRRGDCNSEGRGKESYVGMKIGKQHESRGSLRVNETQLREPCNVSSQRFHSKQPIRAKHHPDRAVRPVLIYAGNVGCQTHTIPGTTSTTHQPSRALLKIASAPRG